MINLPQAFRSRMEQFLGTEAEDFFLSYEKEHAYGLRMNLLKQKEILPEQFPFSLSPVPWCKEGYYALYEEHPGKHPLHAAGAYYIQEPSAMSVVTLLSPAPGEKICDLCAAPGGKSTQIAGRLHGKGLLVSNEIIPSRAKILSENLERFGTLNAVITNETPDRMAEHFPEFFDKILIDAPCSGEGMFRKDETAIREWSEEQVEKCAKRQKTILACAEKMLKPGGILVYSTCTFSKAENEDILQWFLDNYPAFSLENWQDFFPEDTGIVSGKNVKEAMRLFPHKLKGEGHFAARLVKQNEHQISQIYHENSLKEDSFNENSSKEHTLKGKKAKIKRNEKKKRGTAGMPPSDYLEFLQKNMPGLSTSSDHVHTTDSILSHVLSEKEQRFELFGDELYLVPGAMNTFEKLKTVRAGLHLGTLKKNRFEPAHALAKAATPDDFLQSIECSLPQADAYLHGETLPCGKNLNGWVLVCFEGLSLGWGKAGNGILKNHYPKGLRI